MIIDSSALIAILEDEPEAKQIIEAITNEPVRLISAVEIEALIQERIAPNISSYSRHKVIQKIAL